MEEVKEMKEEKEPVLVFDNGKYRVAPDFVNWEAISQNVILEDGDIYCQPFGGGWTATPKKGCKANSQQWGKRFKDLLGADGTYAVYRPIKGPRILAGNPVFSERLPLP